MLFTRFIQTKAKSMPVFAKSALCATVAQQEYTRVIDYKKRSKCVSAEKNTWVAPPS